VPRGALIAWFTPKALLNFTEMFLTAIRIVSSMN